MVQIQLETPGASPEGVNFTLGDAIPWIMHSPSQEGPRNELCGSPSWFQTPSKTWQKFGPCAAEPAVSYQRELAWEKTSSHFCRICFLSTFSLIRPENILFNTSVTGYQGQNQLQGSVCLSKQRSVCCGHPREWVNTLCLIWIRGFSSTHKSSPSPLHLGGANLASAKNPLLLQMGNYLGHSPLAF